MGQWAPSLPLMKSTQTTLSTLVILQIAITALLAIVAVLSYQGQAEIHGLRQDVATMQAEWEGRSQDTVAERLTALESRTGLRDSEADRVSAALQEELNAASELDQRLANMKPTPSPSTASAKEAILAPTTPQSPVTETPAPNEAAIPSDLPPAERAVAKLPVVAEIVTYEKEWGFFTIQKGQLDGLTADQEFGVRPRDGYTLLARVKINRLHPKDAVLDLVAGSRQTGSREPQAGDLLVDISSLK